MSDPAPMLVPCRGPLGAAAPLYRQRARYPASPKPSSHMSAGQQSGSLLQDILLVCIDAVVIFYLRFFSGHLTSSVPVAHYLGFLVLYATLVTIFCQNQGLYQPWRNSGPLDESFSVLKAVVLARLLLTAFIYVSGDKSISRIVVALIVLLNAVTLPAC